MKRARQFGFWMLVALLLVGPRAWAQMAVGDETHLRLTGDGSFGYNGVRSDQTGDQDQYGFGGIFTLDGYYHHPNFLSFRLTPYYNQSRLNSSFNSLFSSKGITATSSIFGGSRFPGEISFEKHYDTEGQFGLPGTSGFTTGGDSTAFSIGWGLAYRKLPPVHVTYSLNNSSTEILGLSKRASFDSHSFGVSSYYTLAGFNLTGSYTNSTLSSEMPLFTDFSKTVGTDSHDNMLQFSANRRLTSWADLTSSVSRTHLITDYAGANSDQTFDAMNASVNLRPTKKLTAVAGVSYASSLDAMLLENAFRSTPSSPLPPLALTETDSDYKNYAARADYRITEQLTVDGGAELLNETFLSTDIQSQRYHGGIGFHHGLLGGQVNVHYGLMQIGMQTQHHGTMGVDQERDTTVQAANVAYTRRFNIKGWRNTASAQYFRNNETALAGYTATSYSGSVTGSHELGAWNVSLTSNFYKSVINGLSNSDSFNMSFGGALAARRFSFGGNYSRSSGNSFQTAGGLIAAPLPAQVLLPQLLVFYGGNSYAVSGSYHPTRRLRVIADYTHTLFETSATSSLSNNVSLRYEGRVEYEFRQMRFTGGFSHISQGLGPSFNTPATVNAFSFGVVRHFDVF